MILTKEPTKIHAHGFGDTAPACPDEQQRGGTCVTQDDARALATNWITALPYLGRPRPLAGRGLPVARVVNAGPEAAQGRVNLHPVVQSFSVLR